CAQVLQKPGNILIFFPEGTRSCGLVPGEFKPGVGLLAAGRDVPIVPCHLAGTNVALPKGAWFPRPSTVRLTIGEPRLYGQLPATKESARQICHELREIVMSLGGASSEPPIRTRVVTNKLVSGKKPMLDSRIDANPIREWSPGSGRHPSG